MPKLVDHDLRREQIVQATWRIIARRGMAGATMRDIAAEAGFANGALRPYFATKNDLLRATFEYVFDRTNERVAVATAGMHGMAALEAFCREVLPLDADLRDEARVAVSFWGEEAGLAEARDLHSASMRVWRGWIIGWLAEYDGGRDWSVAAESLLTFLLGAQITAALEPGLASEGFFEAQLRSQLAHLRS